MAWITPSNVSTGDVLTAATWNQDVVANTTSLPRGYIARAQVTANQTGISSTTDVTNATVTFTAVSSRLYRTTFYCGDLQQLTSNGYPAIYITDGSNVQKQLWTKLLLSGYESAVFMQVWETGLSGSVTRKARAGTNAGSVTLIANATSPMQLMVEDMGAA